MSKLLVKEKIIEECKQEVNSSTFLMSKEVDKILRENEVL